MKYMLLMFGEESTWEQATPEERAAVYEEFGAFDGAPIVEYEGSTLP